MHAGNAVRFFIGELVNGSITVDISVEEVDKTSEFDDVVMN